MATESIVVDDQIVRIAIDQNADKALNKTLTVKEKVLIALQTWATQRGTNEIYQTVDDLAAVIKVHKPTLATTLAGMVNRGEIEMVKERKGKVTRIVGFILKKAKKPEEIVAAAVDKVKKDPQVMKKFQPKILDNLTHLKHYLDQKDAVERARQILVDAGLEGEEGLSLNFPIDPLAEEANMLYVELVEATRLLGEARLEIEAHRRTTPLTS